MNSKQTFLALVRTAYPKLYWQAVAKVFSPRAGLGGLGDDLTNTITLDPSMTTPALAVPDVSQETTDAINNATAAAQAQPSTDWFGQLANAITTIAPTVVQTQAAENLLQINSQRAAQNLPLYTSNGQMVTASMLSPTSASVAQMEAALAGSSSWLLPIVLMGGLALVMASRSKS